MIYNQIVTWTAFAILEMFLGIFGEISVAIVFGLENLTFLAKKTNQSNDDGDDDVFVNLPNTLGAFCYFFTLRPNQVLWLKSS